MYTFYSACTKRFFYAPTRCGRNGLLGQRQEWFRNHSCTTCSQATPWVSLIRNLTRYSCSILERRSAHTEIADRELNTFIPFCTHRPLRFSPETGCASRSSLCFIFTINFFVLTLKVFYKQFIKVAPRLPTQLVARHAEAAIERARSRLQGGFYECDDALRSRCKNWRSPKRELSDDKRGCLRVLRPLSARGPGGVARPLLVHPL